MPLMYKKIACWAKVQRCYYDGLDIFKKHNMAPMYNCFVFTHICQRKTLTLFMHASTWSFFSNRPNLRNYLYFFGEINMTYHVFLSSTTITTHYFDHFVTCVHYVLSQWHATQQRRYSLWHKGKNLNGNRQLMQSTLVYSWLQLNIRSHLLRDWINQQISPSNYHHQIVISLHSKQTISKLY